MFTHSRKSSKSKKMIMCEARIEKIKAELNLTIKNINEYLEIFFLGYLNDSVEKKKVKALNLFNEDFQFHLKTCDILSMMIDHLPSQKLSISADVHKVLVNMITYYNSDDLDLQKRENYVEESLARLTAEVEDTIDGSDKFIANLVNEKSTRHLSNYLNTYYLNGTSHILTLYKKKANSVTCPLYELKKTIENKKIELKENLPLVNLLVGLEETIGLQREADENAKVSINELIEMWKNHITDIKIKQENNSLNRRVFFYVGEGKILSKSEGFNTPKTLLPGSQKLENTPASRLANSEPKIKKPRKILRATEAWVTPAISLPSFSDEAITTFIDDLKKSYDIVDFKLKTEEKIDDTCSNNEIFILDNSPRPY